MPFDKNHFDGDVYIRAIDPYYATSGPDEVNLFSKNKFLFNQQQHSMNKLVIDSAQADWHWEALQLPHSKKPNIILILADDLCFSGFGLLRRREIKVPVLGDHLSHREIWMTQMYK